LKLLINRYCLHLVGYLYYWQMGFNSVFKGLMLCPVSSLFLRIALVVFNKRIFEFHKNVIPACRWTLEAQKI